VIYPTVAGMAAEGLRYQGFLYAGLMIDSQGNPKVIEFNCRFGDPETQPIMLRMESDLVELCLAGANGQLAGKKSQWSSCPALGIVIAAGGYPGDYRRGDIISGLEPTSSMETKVFHAGTAMKNGDIVTAGGRVLCVTALSNDIEQAQKNAYQAAKD
ncbi:phosphoribosylamine--glycine ligase, partial [Pseudomonas marginalis]|uniref:phosphoribosylamine--glycine ligase n=1 Tax=Pseudomonas marginalis TaxID=298 RepID=UPI002B1DC33C